MRGPGFYAVNLSEMNAKAIPEQLQCFNSTQNRFGKMRESQEIIGPTTYDLSTADT
jgi:hypothetical protein